CGIVHVIDDAADPAVSVLGTFPAETHEPITYPAALLTSAADPADKAFFEALSADAADRVFADQGFSILN
ncbi:substrate-binding domain-containing protein, partial [Paracoccus sp. (in: a-proteobacteria)]|uniref:substrate-binding domain-containing protein n=1 Tax=Paracoccus sp. TaxID=267 RepID=UPI0026E105B4